MHERQGIHLPQESPSLTLALASTRIDLARFGKHGQALFGYGYDEPRRVKGVSRTLR